MIIGVPMMIIVANPVEIKNPCNQTMGTHTHIYIEIEREKLVSVTRVTMIVSNLLSNTFIYLYTA